MTQPLLSILIPTVDADDRHISWNNLLHKIFEQSGLPRDVGRVVAVDNYCMNYWQQEGCAVEVISCFDRKQMTIGEKRELLYKEATGIFSMQIDDDDTIADNAIELILQAIKDSNVDCITFQEHCLMNGVEYGSNHSIIYSDWDGDGSRLLHDGWYFHRTPFMKSVIKTEIARSVPIPHIRYGEDIEWSRALKPHLKSEVHIPEYLYFYQHNSKPEDFNERYGIK